MKGFTALGTMVRRWFPETPFRVGPLPAAGFSGSPVWLVESLEPGGATAKRHVLKGFAGTWSPERAASIHRLMAVARRAGVGAVPANLEVAAGDDSGPGTIATDGGGACFEMTPWHPGQPVAAPSPRQAAAALETLARIHVALRGTAEGAGRRHAPPPAWGRRVDALRAVIEHGWNEPVTGIASSLAAAVADRRRAAAALLRERGGLPLLARLAAVVPPPVPLQPVLRDVWQAHLLFVGDEVSAVIDWHAAGIDTPAADLARLLGSWEIGAANPAGARRISTLWSDALGAYRAIRPLAAEELSLIDLLHLAGVVGGLHHWFTWVLDEARSFPDPAAVLGRVDFLLKNLDSVLDQTDAGSGGVH